MKTSPDSRQRGLATWIYLVLLVATAAASFLVLLLYQNVVARKAEATKDVFRVVEVSEQTEDPAIWGKNYPRQYDSYKRTVDTERTNHGGSESFQRLEEFPLYRTLFAGYAFGVDYREERGHAYMLRDQDATQRVNQFKQPGSCLHCHASVLPAYIAAGLKDGIPAGPAHREAQIQRGFEKISPMPFHEAREQVSHPVTCIDCHDAESMALRVSRPAFINGIRSLAESGQATPHLPSIERWRRDGRKEPYEPNVLATRQELRSMVCAQCHVEYHFAAPNKLVTYPWNQGLKVEQIEQHYNQVGHTDWTHAESGAKLLKAQHPEFELWSQGIHARSGVSCADCHMPYVREGAIKVSNHHVRSPLLNVAQSCQSCHRIPEKEIMARALTVQNRNAALLTRAEEATVELIQAIGAARKAGATDEKLQAARDLHRKAQWRLDFVAAENSMGFHAPQEAARILAEAIDYARQGEIAVAKETKPGGGGGTGALK
jgi:nitrite reductase (cytochrome c-552)